MLLAPVRNIGLCRMCVEVKAAHSRDIVEGLTRQLPQYMASTSVSLGAYVVLWFGTYFGHADIDKSEAMMRLDGAALITLGADTLKGIRVFFVDVTKAQPASKRSQSTKY